MKNLFPVIFIFLLPLISFGQVDPFMDTVMIANQADHEAAELALQNYSAQKAIDNCNLFTVVVHVIYDGLNNNRGKISENQVRSQIRITNQFLANDSLRYNENNTELPYRLKLANVDPNGNYTTGIDYIDGTQVFGPDWSEYGVSTGGFYGVGSYYSSLLANLFKWDTNPVDGTKYMNVYVTHRINGSSESGVQGFAWFPSFNIANYYGSYVLANTFGAEDLENDYGETFDLKFSGRMGSTFTHELLHNFSLYHTFQGQSCAPESNCQVLGDMVCDTPPQIQAGSCIIGTCGFVSENMMDYLPEYCRVRISPGQVARATNAVELFLSDYLTCPEEYECEELNGNPGFPCSTDDVSVGIINDDCECIPLIYDCPELQANVGDICNDGNPGTINDVITEDCECVGEPSCQQQFFNDPVDNVFLYWNPLLNEMRIKWTMVPNSTACQIQWRTYGDQLIKNAILWEWELNSVVVPNNLWEPNTKYKVRIRCGCSDNPMVATPWKTNVVQTPNVSSEIYPNPSTSDNILSILGDTEVHIELHDIQGVKIRDIYLGKNIGEYHVNLSDLVPGVYLYRIVRGSSTETVKFIKLP